uniref:ATP synthase F0 subunit 8 n=1 Tax=Hydropsyche pellucidula TaxID=869943 RepID=A0A0U3DL40_9NEOP|nr:ATP synthase F0 subunit 8 [Hydropsyche pellucidula]ALT58529.1 ATP synthase F0 subunit 8 [Hydropsyche pellucidula]
MPQMMPLNWLMLMFFFTSILFFSLSFFYYMKFFSPINKLILNKSIKSNKMNWMW